jgi:hypothetical protein
MGWDLIFFSTEKADVFLWVIYELMFALFIRVHYINIYIYKYKKKKKKNTALKYFLSVNAINKVNTIFKSNTFWMINRVS